MSWRPNNWEKINPRPANPFEAGRDIWCRYCSYRNIETGANSMLEALKRMGERCMLDSVSFNKAEELSAYAQPIVASDFGKIGTKGWLVFIPDKEAEDGLV